MFEDFLNHKCNIYHLEDVDVNAGYGIKKRSVKQAGTVAAIKEQPCHFHVKAENTLRIVQDEPFSTVDGEVKLTLPPGVDIRENDTVEDCGNGLKFRAGIPHTIHGGHHIIVNLYREGGVKSAI